VRALDEVVQHRRELPIGRRRGLEAVDGREAPCHADAAEIDVGEQLFVERVGATRALGRGLEQSREREGVFPADRPPRQQLAPENQRRHDLPEETVSYRDGLFRHGCV